jgi:Ca-activated chloride channel family protein
LLIIVLTLALGQAWAIGQEPVNDDVIKVSTDLLLFPIRIRDKQKQPVSGLTEQDLTLRDDGRAISSLLLTKGADRIALVIALDESGSLRTVISQQREAALALFRQFSERSRVAVIRFAEAPALVAPFGRDTEAVRAAFDFSVGNQHTAIFDGAQAALAAFKTLPPDRAERRIVVLISDGLDNASKVSANPVIDRAVDEHVSFYVIHLPLFTPRDGRLAVRPAAKGFRDLAEKTGGKYFLAGDQRTALAPQHTVDLTPVFQAIEQDLKSQYLLGFYVAETARDGRKHEFSVTLPAGLEYSVGKLGYSRKQKFYAQLR